MNSLPTANPSPVAQPHSVSAVIFNLQGILLADSKIQRQVTEELLQNWGIVLKPGEYRQVCLGRSDYEGLWAILERRGRAVNEQVVAELVRRKQHLYRERITRALPPMPGAHTCLEQVRQRGLLCALVSSLPQVDGEWILTQLGYRDYFSAVVYAADQPADQLERGSYDLVCRRLPGNLDPWSCLVIESTYAGILAAQSLGMLVLALPSSVPFHMLQRRADWVVDRLDQIDWEELFTPLGSKRLVT
ncbi:HAD family hydrolase [Anthocerotibacter panamensis]|uniref:HAD family hydrolase n=1 Tax=Anthocerotibacter panamensis TaxID=2857077 RepID=UPI001C408867|nr:HAD family phosphatase [Anthocerotibacter panamensis]